jgi:dTDP-4-dehydrorhamnose reductase
MTRLLFTGASGFLGFNFLRLFNRRFEITGTCLTHLPERSPVPCQRLDLTDQAHVRAFFRDFRPEAVIHAAALSNPNTCQARPEDSRTANLEATAFLAQLCADADIPFVFTSTDLVFDGESAPYREADPPRPVSLYGEHKARAEAEVLSRHPGAVVCRMPLMYGESGPVNPSFLDFMLKAVVEGRALTLFTDEWRTPVSGADAARGLALALDLAMAGDFRGILHLGGRERLSRYEFGEIFLRVLGRPEVTPKACLRADVPMPAPRPRDVSLASARAFGLGYAPNSVEEELARIVPALKA